MHPRTALSWLSRQWAGLRERWRRQPPPRLCGWCHAPLPGDAPDEQLYCKRSHAKKAGAKRNHGTTHPSRARRRTEQQLTAAWTLNSTYAQHAASCDKKHVYVTLGDALAARRWLVQDTGNDKVTAYRCLACGGFHLTSGLSRGEKETA